MTGVDAEITKIGFSYSGRDGQTYRYTKEVNNQNFRLKFRGKYYGDSKKTVRVIIEIQRRSMETASSFSEIMKVEKYMKAQHAKTFGGMLEGHNVKARLNKIYESINEECSSFSFKNDLKALEDTDYYRGWYRVLPQEWKLALLADAEMVDQILAFKNEFLSGEVKFQPIMKECCFDRALVIAERKNKEA